MGLSSSAAMQIALLRSFFFVWLGCRATGESVLEVHVWMIFRYWRSFCFFGVVAALVLARPAGPLGRALWRCIFGWLLAMPKLYHHSGLQGSPKMAPTQP